jgi:hypothetical protein
MVAEQKTRGLSEFETRRLGPPEKLRAGHKQEDGRGRPERRFRDVPHATASLQAIPSSAANSTTGLDISSAVVRIPTASRKTGTSRFS